MTTSSPKQLTYDDLIHVLQGIDPNAGNWLDTVGRSHGAVKTHKIYSKLSHVLDYSVYWEDTPQGHHFWKDITSQLKDIEEQLQTKGLL